MCFEAKENKLNHGAGADNCQPIESHRLRSLLIHVPLESLAAAL